MPPQKHYSPSFLPRPLLNLQTVQGLPPFFWQFPLIYWFFVNRPEKSPWIFQLTLNIKTFLPSPHPIFLKVTKFLVTIS